MLPKANILRNHIERLGAALVFIWAQLLIFTQAIQNFKPRQILKK